MERSETWLPQAITLYLTYHCELSCSHCFINRADLLNSRHLEFDAIWSLIDDAANNKVIMLALTGGSPLLHPRLFDIIELARASKIMPLLGITGVDVDAILAQRIANSGVASVQVSLDGHNEETNTYYRGKGVFERVLSTIAHLGAVGVPVIIAFCLDAFNHAYITEMLDLARRKNVYNVKVAFWAADEAEVSVRQKHRVLSDLQKQLVCKMCHDFETRHNLRGWLHLVDTPDAAVTENSVETGRVVVDPSGDVRLHEAAIPIGNIHDAPLSYIYTKHFGGAAKLTPVQQSEALL